MFEGTIRKRNDGRLEMQITVGVDANGKRIRKSFYGKTEREVKKKRDKWIKETDIYGLYNIGKTEEFSPWADIWLETYKKPSVRPYTYLNTYKRRVDKYLKPYFKNRPLNAISQMDVQRFFNEHSELSLASLETLRVILGNMFKIAIINGLCTQNPVEDIRLNSLYFTEERKAYNERQQRIAIDWCIKNNEYAILTILKTGIRRGELCGLRPCDINIDNKTISINRSMSPKTTYDDYIDYSLKTKCSKRIVPIDDELCGILIGILDNTPKNKYSESLFEVVSVNAFAKKATIKLKKMSEECNIPYLTLHELRHTYGTVLRERGVDIYTISKLLGHSSIGVTSSIYVHNDVEVLRRAMNI